MRQARLPSATTRLAVVIGDPVRHSMSPTIHNAGFSAVGFDAVYLALPVKAGDAAEAVAAMRRFDLLGMSVTMPHKHDIAKACDQLTDPARVLGAVNCLFWRDGQIVGDNTDGQGFVRGLAADLQVDPGGQRCVVVGAGGAAKAVVRSLAVAGASDVVVVNRNAERAQAAVQLGGGVARIGILDDLGQADIVINATPVGMADTAQADGTPFDVAVLADHAVVADLIYHPAETVLLARARARGLRAQNGLPMLIHQAAVAFEHWTGVDAPVAVMTAATSGREDGSLS